MVATHSSNNINRLVVTADDFGLSEEINLGIIDAHRDGIVTTASLAVNAPATAHAVQLALKYPKLQVGLHLSIVEGISLRGQHSTITDELSYFGKGPCLHRDWRTFLPRLLTGRIRLSELAEELSLQIREFERLLGRIPFANSTQHLHLLPGIANITLSLAIRHGIPLLRLPRRFSDAGNRSRACQSALLQAFSAHARRNARKANIATPDTCLGFSFSGRLDEKKLTCLLQSLRGGTTEIIAHPGRNCPSLREQLPNSYSHFDWETERTALISPRIQALVRDSDLTLSHFAGQCNDT